MLYKTLFFDLDATLYSPSNGLLSDINLRIQQYMVEVLGLPAAEVPDLHQAYFQRYGTTLSGLRQHHAIDTDDYLRYVHDLPLEDYLTPDPELHELLASLPQAKWVFTNASHDYAHQVLEILGTADLFQGVIASGQVDHQSKPSPSAYRKALALAGTDRPEQAVLFDDRIENLVPAQKLGIFTVLINQDPTDSTLDLQADRIHDLPHRFPQLWNHSLPS